MGRNPTSVFGSVIAVYVDTVEFITERLLTFIGEEVLKGIPTGADANTSASVVPVAGVTRIVAPAAHVEPSAISRVRLHALAVFKRVFLMAKASAAFCMTATEVLRYRDDFLSAIHFSAFAAAKPMRIAVFRIRGRNVPNHGQHAKFLACKVC
jgi:hypothetical protein